MAQRAMVKEDLGWYEAGLSLLERKKRGHFSTPPLLVERILDVCGYTAQANLTHLRVLDPACGSGNFLVGAAHRLMAFGERAGLSHEERVSLVERNLWGFDPDPVSCFLAEMQLRMSIEYNALHHIPLSLHIHQADSLVLPWEPCVDLFIANPPYLAARNNDLSGYRFVQGRGQADSYLLFLNLALSVVRPGGWIGLVLPDPLLARVNASRERARLLKEVTLHHLWHLSGVFAADVGAVVIIGQRCSSKSTHQVSWIRERWREAGRPGYAIPQSVFLRQPGAELRYLLSSERGAVIERLRAYLENTSGENKRLVHLSEFLSICRGEELGRESPWLVEMAPLAGRPADSARSLPVLRGGVDIHPYTIPNAHWQIAHNVIVKPIERYLSPKLLVVKSTDRLQAALDLQGHVALQTLYLLHLRNKSNDEDSLYFFLALLNSQLLRDYVYILHTAYKWVQPQIEQYVLARLPIPIVEQEQRQQVIERAKNLVRACSKSGAVVEWDADITRMYEEQERAICALYNMVLPG
ncbi:MAG TPA: N-6 DNA methylase [Ktedonobacteraceae bacterium]